jgi:uncharacterized membrane protein YhiD involved in acid resistance
MAIITLQQAATNLGVAVTLGAAIGFERQWRQRLAGLRTNTLVALGAVNLLLRPLVQRISRQPTSRAPIASKSLRQSLPRSARTERSSRLWDA